MQVVYKPDIRIYRLRDTGKVVTIQVGLLHSTVKNVRKTKTGLGLGN